MVPNVLIRKAYAFYKNGASLRHCAVLAGITSATVWYRFKKLGLPIRSHLESCSSPEFCRKISELLQGNQYRKGIPHTAEVIAGIRERSTGRRHNKETKKKMSRVHKKRWASYSVQRKSAILQKGILSRQSHKDTSLETILYCLLQLSGARFSRKPVLYGLSPDAYVPSKKIAFEADGKAWHSDDTDSLRDFKLRKSGIRVYRLTEKDLRSNPKKCLRFIRETLHV